MRIFPLAHSLMRLFPLTLLAAVIGSSTSISLVYGANLDYLASHSSAAVVGSVTTRVEGPHQVSFTIAVERVLSGSLPASVGSLKIVHSWAGVLRGPDQTIVESLHGIWFVRQTSPEAWDVLVARPSSGVKTIAGLYLPAAATAPTSGPYSYSPGASTVDALSYELAYGVQWANADPVLMRDAYGGMTTSAVQSILQTCLSSTNASLQAVGLAGILERQMPGALHQFADLWPTVASDPHSADVLNTIRDAWRDPTPSGVAQLSSIAAERPAGDQLRAASAHALAALHTRESLSFLAGLLVSTDSDERIRGIYGLSAFANGCPVQTQNNVVSLAYLVCDGPSQYKTPDTVANFAFGPVSQTQERSLISFWKTWWYAHAELH